MPTSDVPFRQISPLLRRASTFNPIFEIITGP